MLLQVILHYQNYNPGHPHTSAIETKQMTGYSLNPIILTPEINDKRNWGNSKHKKIVLGITKK